eukprot:843320-Pyramimonas_sp.AAC.1
MKRPKGPQEEPRTAPRRSKRPPLEGLQTRRPRWAPKQPNRAPGSAHQSSLKRPPRLPRGTKTAPEGPKKDSAGGP